VKVSSPRVGSEPNTEIRPRYWAPVEHNSTLTAELELIGAAKKVLEIGPGSGHMTEALARQNCAVTCVEVNENLTSVARSFCQRMIIADIEQLRPDDAFAGEQFDVILFGDVLEHLKDPATILRKLRGHLAPSGYLVASLPNVAHASVRLALFNGDFNYTEEGLLDRTHLKFFTLATIVALMGDAGYRIAELRRTRVGVFNTEVKLSIEKVAPALLRKLMRDAEATTYQFIFSARPSAAIADGRMLSDTAAFMDTDWSARKGKSRLAKSMARKGRALLRENAAGEARAWLSRSFMLRPRIPTIIYLLLSFMRRSKGKNFHAD
jgi:2-polyprenyl-3-methyl-5-hydroxy-6-metoxy-1,4-benzoquinol methylase